MSKRLRKVRARLEARRLNWEKCKTGPSGKHTHRRPGSQKK